MPDNSMYNKEEEVKDYEYEDEFDKKIKRRKIIGISILALLLLVAVFLFLRACFTDTDFVEVSGNEKTLLKAGKEYFSTNYEKAPTEKGECKKVTLNTLLLQGFIQKKNFVNCGGKSTYVQVCKLENKEEHWTPVLACDEVNTNFDSWQRGDENDLVANQSDVKFRFLGQKVDTTDATLGSTEEYWQDKIPYSAYKKIGETTYYKSRTKLYIWNLNKKVYYPGSGYYVSSPASGYNKKDSGRTAYKWYKSTNVTKKVYYKRSFVKQSDVTITEPYTVYECKKTKTSKGSKYQFTPCSEEGGFPYQVRTYKACNSVVPTTDNKCYKCSAGKLNNAKTQCGYYTDWTYTSSCTVGDLCKRTTETTTKKTYYPSGASSASGEKTYYVSSPASGYNKKDSGRTAYKWYKLVKTGTTSVASNVAPNKNATRTSKYTYGAWTKWTTTRIIGTKRKQVKTRKKIQLQQYENISSEDWKDITDGYVSENRLIQAFKDANVNVKSLKEINTNGEIRYKLRMYYRNRIEEGVK